MKKSLMLLGLLFFITLGIIVGDNNAQTLSGVLVGNVIRPYGVSWDEDNSSPTLTRTGAFAASTAASAPGNDVLPIQSRMKRCILNDAGVVQYYLCSTDSTKKADCLTASVLDGTDGQVMVEIPKFYYRYTYNTTTHVHEWSISLYAETGYEAHPAFYKDGAWVDYRYMSAYEGVGWDNSVSAYIDPNYTSASVNWSGTTIDTVNDKLGSVSGLAPMAWETRDEFRTISLNRGVGWRQQDFYLISAIQLLYVVEYASFYSQSVIGEGRTGLSGGTWTKDSYIGVTGKSNGDGNGTNSVGGNSNTAYMTYRGVENFFGNVWKWVDGFNINGGIPYVSNTETAFAENTTTAYSRLLDTGGTGITLPQGADNYQTTLEQTKGGFLPSAVGGSSSTYITDYYYQNTGWRLALFGGVADAGAVAGFFDWNLYLASAYVSVTVGARVCF